MQAACQPFFEEVCLEAVCLEAVCLEAVFGQIAVIPCCDERMRPEDLAARGRQGIGEPAHRYLCRALGTMMRNELSRSHR